MAIVCSQQALDLLRRLCRQYTSGSRLSITSPDFFGTLRLPIVRHPLSSQVLLNIGYAVQFPVTTALHPLVSRPNITDCAFFPSLGQLISQTAIFLIIDYVSQHFLVRYYEEIFKNDEHNPNEPQMGVSSASEVATDFTASETTSVLAVTFIQLSPSLRYFTGALHFAALWCWLMIRTHNEK